jgi:pimeloyl-ACP methyl ester carboxylesterase
MAAVLFKGVRAFYQICGQGQPIMLLHAGGSSSTQWPKVADQLAANHRIIAPDLLGFGATGSWPVAGGLTHDLQADLVAEVMRSENSAALDIVGHSYGGATAIRLLLGRPQLVRSLVLIEPIISWLLRDAKDLLYDESVGVARAFIASVDAGRSEEGWEAFLDSRNGAGTWARMSDKGKARFLAQSHQTKEGFISNLNNHTTLFECRGIEVPTTVVCGAETTTPDRRTTELLRDAIPRSHYDVIRGAAHMSPFTHPEQVAQIIREHLARVQRLCHS